MLTEIEIFQKVNQATRIPSSRREAADEAWIKYNFDPYTLAEPVGEWSDESGKHLEADGVYREWHKRLFHYDGGRAGWFYVVFESNATNVKQIIVVIDGEVIREDR